MKKFKTRKLTGSDIKCENKRAVLSDRIKFATLGSIICQRIYQQIAISVIATRKLKVQYHLRKLNFIDLISVRPHGCFFISQYHLPCTDSLVNSSQMILL